MLVLSIAIIVLINTRNGGDDIDDGIKAAKDIDDDHDRVNGNNNKCINVIEECDSDNINVDTETKMKTQPISIEDKLKLNDKRTEEYIQQLNNTIDSQYYNSNRSHEIAININNNMTAEGINSIHIEELKCYDTICKAIFKGDNLDAKHKIADKFPFVSSEKSGGFIHDVDENQNIVEIYFAMNGCKMPKYDDNNGQQ